ncbi:MAG TPA: glycosyltransferase family 1 protein [bacterium]|nr:glycosyltransferase family 1 protein [bacterium]
MWKKQNNIGIEFSPLLKDSIGGIPTFIKNLSENLIKINNDYNYFQCYKISRLKKFWKLFPKSKSFGRLFYDKNFVIPLNKLNLFHGTAEWIPLKLKNVPKIITIHDMRGIENDKPLEKKRYQIKYEAIKYGAELIVVDSTVIKNELLKKIKNVESERIKVIPPGFNEKFKQITEIQKKEQILFVGTIAKNKNVIGLIKAFKIVNEKIKEIKLIICGQATDKVYYNEIKTYILKNSLEKNIIFLHNAKDNDLIELYNESKLFVLPSFYEGFGIPVLEAQACGCPVIISNQDALLEVADKSALICNANDINDIAEKIIYLLNNETMQKELIKKGIENIRRYSWIETAKKREVYRHGIPFS